MARNKVLLVDQSTNGSFVTTQDGKEAFVRRDSVALQGAGLIGLGTCRSHSRQTRSCTGSKTDRRRGDPCPHEGLRRGGSTPLTTIETGSRPRMVARTVAAVAAW